MLRKYLDHTTYAVLTDADVLVHNFDAKLEQYVDDDHDVWLMDGFEQSTAVWIVRNSEYGRRFVDKLLGTFELNDDDQCGFGNLLVTMLRREKEGKDPLPPDLAPAMPCGNQNRLIARINTVRKCLEDELKR